MIPQQTIAMRAALRQRLETRVTLALLPIRSEIVAALYPDGNFQPGGSCSSCGHNPTAEEILRGFSNDPFETTTACPRCSNRFQPRFIAQGNASSIELPMYCELQTLVKLEDLIGSSFEEIRRNHPAVLASARYYWGSLTAGFRLLEIEFLGEPPVQWQERLGAFLGKVPDTMIAEIAGSSRSAVRSLRLKHKVPAYKRKRSR